ncbi:thioredoxin [Clostridia bacterium]|nr:thioredoxin [Clostridia bacterium]
MLNVEFFHDVICSFCFPFSYRFRKYCEQFDDLNITHHSFSLIWTEDDFVQKFGSRKKAKEAILTHWEHANQNDDLHRFNIQAMKDADFEFPTSRNGLLAAKAVSLAFGEEHYWDMFDCIQKALFVDTKNIDSLDVLENCVKEIGLDTKKWRQQFEQAQTLQSVEEDLKLLSTYNIEVSPTLLVNKKHYLCGALSTVQLTERFEELRKFYENQD